MLDYIIRVYLISHIMSFDDDITHTIVRTPDISWYNYQYITANARTRHNLPAYR